MARHLAGKGFKIWAMTRKVDSDAAKALAAAGAEIVKGDLDDAASIEAALTGAWGAFAVQNTWEAGVEGEEAQGKRFATVARKVGVQHFVYSSVGSAHRQTGIPHFENKWRIGKSYGFDLDRGHIKDFLATAGVGMASQFVEQIGVKLLGNVFGRGLMGGLLGGVATQAVSSGFSFATTYALGRLAIRYYAGGRTFSTQTLKDAYAGLLGEAKGLQGQYLPAIQEKARTVNVAQILQDVRQ